MPPTSFLQVLTQLLKANTAVAPLNSLLFSNQIKFISIFIWVGYELPAGLLWFDLIQQTSLKTNQLIKGQLVFLMALQQREKRRQTQWMESTEWSWWNEFVCGRGLGPSHNPLKKTVCAAPMKRAKQAEPMKNNWFPFLNSNQSYFHFACFSSASLYGIKKQL